MACLYTVFYSHYHLDFSIWPITFPGIRTHKPPARRLITYSSPAWPAAHIAHASPPCRSEVRRRPSFVSPSTPGRNDWFSAEERGRIVGKESPVDSSFLGDQQSSIYRRWLLLWMISIYRWLVFPIYAKNNWINISNRQNVRFHGTILGSYHV